MKIMSLACKCDRCQKLFSIENNVEVKKIKIGSGPLHDDLKGRYNLDEYDLCDSCAEDLVAWFEKGEKEDEKKNKTVDESP